MQNQSIIQWILIQIVKMQLINIKHLYINLYKNKTVSIELIYRINW